MLSSFTRSQAPAWERTSVKLRFTEELKTSTMARTRYRIFETEYPYFMTCTINAWLPVFTRSESAEVIFDSWRHLQRERDFKLFGYVILENHLHLIASAPELSDVMRSFKSYTAHQLLTLLKQHAAVTLLKQLRFHKLKHKADSEFQVWQEGSKPKQIQNDEMMWQKLNTIHENPVKRGFVDDPLHWRWTSARNYVRQPGLIDVVTDWM